MKYIETELNGIFIIEPAIHTDDRGWFSETFIDPQFRANMCDTSFVQDNESFSRYGVIRGLHYQLPPFAQAKLVRVVHGTIIDVAVDIRRSSPTFGKYVAVELSRENHRQLFIPHGFAHGFCVTAETALVQYKCDSIYSPQHEATIRWDDPTLNIEWNIPPEEVITSPKDAAGLLLEQARLFD